MNLQKMRIRLKKRIVLAAVFILTPLLGMAQDCVNETDAGDIIKSFYKHLNTYAYQFYQYGEEEVFVEDAKNRVLNCFVSKKAIVKLDIGYLNNEKTSATDIDNYLTVLKRISKNRKVEFEVVGNPKMYKKKNQFQVIINVKSTKNSFQNTIIFTFKGEKIENFVYIDKFKKIDNLDSKPEPEEPDPKKKESEVKKLVYPLDSELLYYSSGIKFGSRIGLPIIEVGIGGLTENWFVSRLKFGVEYFSFLLKEEYTHYPTSSNGQPSTMTYAVKKDGDFGTGFNVGYTFLPGKHYQSKHHLTACIGIGGAFYDFWYEKTGTSKSDYVSHHSSALYLKPSLRYDFKFIGVEAGYYFCPNYSPMQGMSIQLIINL